MICLPAHDCGVAYGDLDPRTNVATCRERRTFIRRGDAYRHQVVGAGCDRTFALCRHCGNRTIVDGGRCEPCFGSHANDGSIVGDQKV